MTNTGDRHPIWDVYNLLRTARLNVRYNEKRLKSLQRRNLYMEFILGLTVSSGMAGLWIWQNAVGGYIWKALITVAAFLAVLKPLLKLSDQIQKTNEDLTSYAMLDYKLQLLITEITQYKKYDDPLRDRFLKLKESEGSIISKSPPESTDNKLIRECYEQVNRELPVDSFYIPED